MKGQKWVSVQPTTTHTTSSANTAASTPTSTDGPKTGDDSHMILWTLLAAECALTGGACGYYGVFREKKDEKDGAEGENQNPDEKEDSNNSDSGNAKVNSGN